MLEKKKKKKTLKGHQQDKINFDSPSTHNEGNLIAILRLLAGNDSCLDEYLKTGPKSTKYISKTIQNKILENAANQI